MKPLKIISILIFVLVSVSFIHPNTKSTSEADLNHLVRLPKTKTENPPLLILLHGVGSNEHDLFSFAENIPDKYLVISARAPIAMGEDSYAWYQVNFENGKPQYNKEQEQSSRKILIKFIENLKGKYSFDKEQVYLCGFSQGAIMSYSVALTRPDLVKGIAVMSGRLLDELKPMILPKKALETLRIHISHGTEDKVLGIHYAREAETYLRSIGLKPQLMEYKGGHTITGEMLNDLIQWLSN